MLYIAFDIVTRLCKTARNSIPATWPIDPRSYIDTLVVPLPRMMPQEEFAALLDSLGAWPSDASNRVTLKRVPARSGSWRFLLYLHQPQFDTLAVLANSEVPLSLFGVHIALDLVTRKRSEAMRIGRYVLQRLVKNGRPTEPLVWKGESELATAYYSWNLAVGSQIALYSDRCTKTTGIEPCTHIEYRLRGATELRKRGLDTFEALAMLDFRHFWNERLDLRRPPSQEELLDAFMRQLRSSRVGESEARRLATRQAKAALMQAHSQHIDAVIANDLLLHLNRIESCRPRVSRLFRKEEHQWMLPPPDNALWAGR